MVKTPAGSVLNLPACVLTIKYLGYMTLGHTIVATDIQFSFSTSHFLL